MSHTRELFKECKVLNIFQVNIWKNLVFMHHINSNTLPIIFLNKFKRPTHNYPTNFTRTNYSIPTFKLNKSKYRTSIRGPTLWKNIPADREKPINDTTCFTSFIGFWLQTLYCIYLYLGITVFMKEHFFIICISSKWVKK